MDINNNQINLEFHHNKKNQPHKTDDSGNFDLYCEI
jgi:hypothetical protein